MDQTAELMELLNIVNLTSSKSVFNFSEATAFSLLNDYLNRMYTLRHPTTIVLMCLYIPVFIVSLTGNALVLFVVYKNAHMRKAKNLFLVNLSVADLAVTVVCIPLVVGEIVFRIWFYGDVLCRLTRYMQGVAVITSIFTLTTLSIDRYLAIKAPLNSRHMPRKCHIYAMICLLWFLAGIFVAPIIYVRNTHTEEFEALDVSVTYCVEIWPPQLDRRSYSITLLVVTYLLPVVAIATCYTLIGRTLCSSELHRQSSDSSSTIILGRKRVARMLVAVIAVFFLCWLPYNIVSLNLDLKMDYADTQLLPFTLWLAHAHSAINPILYWFLNRSFRHCMRKVLICPRHGSANRNNQGIQYVSHVHRFGNVRRCEVYI